MAVDRACDLSPPPTPLPRAWEVVEASGCPEATAAASAPRLAEVAGADFPVVPATCQTSRDRVGPRGEAQMPSPGLWLDPAHYGTAARPTRGAQPGGWELSVLPAKV